MLIKYVYPKVFLHKLYRQRPLKNNIILIPDLFTCQQITRSNSWKGYGMEYGCESRCFAVGVVNRAVTFGEKRGMRIARRARVLKTGHTYLANPMKSSWLVFM